MSLCSKLPFFEYNTKERTKESKYVLSIATKGHGPLLVIVKSAGIHWNNCRWCMEFLTFALKQLFSNFSIYCHYLGGAYIVWLLKLGRYIIDYTYMCSVWFLRKKLSTVAQLCSFYIDYFYHVLIFNELSTYNCIKNMLCTIPTLMSHH